MQNNTKKFDKELFDENDSSAREAVREYFSNIGIYLIDNPDKYGVDMLATMPDGEIVAAFEVERRPNWTGDEFPFSTIHIPYRKKKFINKDYIGSTYYCVVNNDLSVMIFVDMKFLKEEMVIEQKNKYVEDGELFYDVPIFLASLRYLKK